MRSRDGYVLLAVIAASILVVTVLSGLAKQSLRRGLQAADAERALQQRWGAITIERAMLKNASQVFQQQADDAEKRKPGAPPSPVIRTKLVLGQVVFDILLGDEDAKLSINALYHHAGLAKTRDAIGEVSGRAVQQATRLRPATSPQKIARENPQLSVTDPDEEEPTLPDAFRSWGEVFNIAALDQTLGNQASLPASTMGLTCWGSGQLNFRRASDEAILAVTSSVVQDGGGRRLLQRYRDNPTMTLSVLLATEISNQRNRERLQEMLSESSMNFSVWIDAYSKTGRSVRTFTAMKRDVEGITRLSRFAF